MIHNTLLLTNNSPLEQQGFDSGGWQIRIVFTLVIYHQRMMLSEDNFDI